MEKLIIDLAVVMALLAAGYIWGIMAITFVQYVRGSKDPFHKSRKTRD